MRVSPGSLDAASWAVPLRAVGWLEHGHGFAVGDVIALVNRFLPIPKPVRVEGPARPEEVADVVADISRARHEFGWEPRVPLPDGLRLTLTWMQQLRTPNIER